MGREIPTLDGSRDNLDNVGREIPTCGWTPYPFKDNNLTCGWTPYPFKDNSHTSCSMCLRHSPILFKDKNLLNVKCQNFFSLS